MTPALLISSLEDALRPLITGAQGQLFVSETPEETISLLAAKPDGFRTILQWQGEDGDTDTHGTSALARISVVLQTPRGLQVDRGADAHRSPEGGAPPILALSDKVKKFLFGLVYTDASEGMEAGALRADVQHHRSKGRRQCFAFLSGDWLEIEGVDLRQYEMTFSIRYSSRADD